MIHPNRQYKIGQNIMKVADTTDSLLNEHRENCQIGLSYIKCTALRHELLPFVKLRTQIFFTTLYRLGYSTVFRTKIFLLFYKCHSVVLNWRLNWKVFYITACAVALCSVKDDSSSKGKTQKFDCSPGANPLTDHNQTWND